eukprot:9003719-Heterocapsa_arctica.AAC.1
MAVLVGGRILGFYSTVEISRNLAKSLLLATLPRLLIGPSFCCLMNMSRMHVSEQMSKSSGQHGEQLRCLHLAGWHPHMYHMKFQKLMFLQLSSRAIFLT